jgi:hypothetical protein
MRYIILLILTAFYFILSSQIHINELMSSNNNTIYDEFGVQSNNISFGRTSDCNEEWIFFNQPTPEAPNYQDNPCETGDINCDGELNVLDVVQLVAFILGNSELTDVQH